MGGKVTDRTESTDKKKYTHSGTVAQEVDLLFTNRNVPGFRKEMGPVPCSQLASHIYIALRSLIGSQWATMNLLFNDNKRDKRITTQVFPTCMFIGCLVGLMLCFYVTVGL